MTWFLGQLLNELMSNWFHTEPKIICIKWYLCFFFTFIYLNCAVEPCCVITFMHECQCFSVCKLENVYFRLWVSSWTERPKSLTLLWLVLLTHPTVFHRSTLRVFYIYTFLNNYIILDTFVKKDFWTKILSVLKARKH
jgi:hypothetical protein